MRRSDLKIGQTVLIKTVAEYPRAAGWNADARAICGQEVPIRRLLTSLGEHYFMTEGYPYSYPLEMIVDPREPCPEIEILTESVSSFLDLI